MTTSPLPTALSRDTTENRLVQRVTAIVAADAARLKADLSAIADAKKLPTLLDSIEEKIIASTALAAAASGTPDQARAMLSKMRAKAWEAAANGASTGALDAAVRTMEHLAEIAETTREAKKHGAGDASAAIIPQLVALGKVS